MGAREEAIGDRYVTCTACGRVWERDKVQLEDKDLPDEALSEQAELCPVCRRERLGEGDAAA